MTDEDYMRRALRLATGGRGTTEPNPSVGCVIVKGGRVIGEGHTQPFGGAHAEPTALANCTEPPGGATAYVTLEPCCHTNKKTPPCVPRVVAAGLTRVVIGCLDPNPDVNGSGVAQLRAAGVRVDGPLLEAEAKQQIAPFIARTIHRRSYVTLKWAQTADGKIAGPGGARMQISNGQSARLVHDLRARSEVIAVGINTVLTDDPLLSARGIAGDRNQQALRVVLDRRLRIPPNARLLDRGTSTVPVRVYHGTGGMGDRIRELVQQGIALRALPVDATGRLSLREMVEDLFDSPAPTHFLVEPGPTLADGFFRDNLCDRLWVFRSTEAVNDPTATAAAAVPSQFVETGRLDVGGDMLIEYLNRGSPVFFAGVPSADFVRAGASNPGPSRAV